MKAMYDSVSASVGYMRGTGQTVSTNLGGNIGEDGKVDPFDTRFKPAPEPQPEPWTPPESASPSAEPWKEPA
jgi:hypothetical protein